MRRRKTVRGNLGFQPTIPIQPQLRIIILNHTLFLFYSNKNLTETPIYYDENSTRKTYCR
jgi:hypothetical protein